MTTRVDEEVTGLASPLFVHVDHDGRGRVMGVRISSKWKDGASIDQLLNALGDSLTDAISAATRERGPE
jgi:DNA-binding protein YbaB